MPESRFYTSYVARHLASGVRPRRRGREFALRAVLLLAVVVSVLGCSRRGDPPGDARASAAPPADPAAVKSSDTGLPPGWWEARSELPEHNRGGLFQGREPTAPGSKRARPAAPTAPVMQAPSGPLPPPLTYVGKVARDGEGFAVLAREERVYIVRVGDAVGNGYVVQSISEKEVVIRNADFDMTKTLFFSTSEARRD